MNRDIRRDNQLLVILSVCLQAGLLAYSIKHIFAFPLSQ